MKIQIIEKRQELKAMVESSHEGAFYIVEQSEDGWSCTCPDHQNRNKDCKHIIEVQDGYT